MAAAQIWSPGWENVSGSKIKDMGDEALVSRVAGGDETALSELYDRYSRPVYATGVRLLGDPSLAEELVQDAFTNVWRGRNRSSRSGRGFRPGSTASRATAQWIWTGSAESGRSL
jgi:Sigma-70 region 2